MTVVNLHQSRILLKYLSNCAIILLAQIFRIRSLIMSVLKLFILRPSFIARLSVCHGQKTQLSSQKMAAAKEITFTIQTSVWFRSSNCYGLFAFIAKRYWHCVKLRLTSCPTWSSTNGQKLKLKALSNGRFLSISLDMKMREDGYSENKKVKIGAAFYISLIVMPY